MARPKTTARNGKPAPARPELPDPLPFDAREYLVVLFRQAVEDLETARARHAALKAAFDATGSAHDRDRYEECREWERLQDLSFTFLNDAEHRVCTAVLVANRRDPYPTHTWHEKDRGWLPCSFEVEGAAYVVAPAEADGDCRPRLIEVASCDNGSASFDAAF